ncbi:MAG: hypothetical protein A2Y12_14570 [Planctomycetes bacterium GWF2_42_9]|nr:MAG: hypothetical protein A2Y12_14570 [Planctomycetes bacterium GWF2_42_9]HAL45877.1 hypothetical protein [Phycisphaerales bacterium]
MAILRKIFRLLAALPTLIFVLIIIGAIYLVAIGIYKGGTALNDILTENKALKKSITNLTEESKIGYAKVIDQKKDANGKVLTTTLRFVETARDNELQKVLEREYTIEGDIIHFDALIVKFSDKMVMDGRKRSLYLWRRIYGEKMSPESGFPIEQFGAQPMRYYEIFKDLPLKERQVFWSAIWDLANNPDQLAEYGISAIYGSVTYSQLRKGLIYIFRITPTGLLYPEVIPEF